MVSPIVSVTSPTHDVNITMDATRRVANVALEGLVQLDKDFELLVALSEPHQPRVVVEAAHPHGLAAMVSLVPQVNAGNVFIIVLY